ncbi:TetR/AcrR family transcriptional regulator [Nocardia sp. NPDC059177]|uniref:TetR/AcrR family transcriptional regulator n=1 Tax=Nocardia sp. NPDC059177 TaxID=3346759 RepID=UPI00367B864E
MGDKARTGGRIRSDAARADVLRASAEILEEHGYRRMTVESVAARSGVAKSTIYRWWRSRAELAMDAYAEAVARRMPEPDTGAVASDLVAFVTELYRVTEFPVRAQALRGMMAEAQLDPEFARHFGEWIGTRRAVVVAMLARGVERGELRADAGLDLAADQLFGVFWYRLLVDHRTLSPEQAAGDVAQLLSGVRARG